MTATARPLEEIVEPGWARALAPVAGQIATMGGFLRAELAAGRRYLPAGEHVLRAFAQPFADVRVLIVGYGSCPTIRTRTSANGCANARSTCSPAGR